MTQGPIDYQSLLSKLSGTEREVLEAMRVWGHASVAAARLGLPPESVRAHMNSIRGKLKVVTDMQAIVIYEQVHGQR